GMVRKKNKKHNQSRQLATSSLANKMQSKSLILIETELQELIR
ncbi:15766_t:CDS:1, partial [Funneliformis caledonium]